MKMGQNSLTGGFQGVLGQGTALVTMTIGGHNDYRKALGWRKLYAIIHLQRRDYNLQMFAKIPA